MKSYLAPTLGLISLTAAAAIPSPDAEPIVRILPTNWNFNITSLRGPGCPDFSNADPKKYNTRLTYGMNTMDGSEIYYWHAAYPYLRASLADQAHSWCETELSYTEYADLERTKKGEFYRMRLHKNGTRVLGTYDLEEGVKATYEVTYEAGRGREVCNTECTYYHHSNNFTQITDEITIIGPYNSGRYGQADNSPVPKKPEIYKLPKCGSGSVKFRVDLYVEGKKGKKGVAASEKITTTDGSEQYYGTQIGWSYDWEKCFTSEV